MNYYKEHKMNGIKERLVIGAFGTVIIRESRFTLLHMNRYVSLSCMFQSNLHHTETFCNYSEVNLLIGREPLLLPKKYKDLHIQKCNFSCFFM
jgi:hypothetical protein